MKKLFFIGSLVLSSAYVFAGDVSSGGVLSPLGESVAKASAVLEAVKENTNHYSKLSKIYTAGSENYIVVETMLDTVCTAQGYEVTENAPSEWTATPDLSAVISCQK